MSAIILLIIRLAMVIALYGFLGWAVWTLWRDIKRQDELMAARRIPEIKLTKQVGAGEVSYEFSTPDILVGRDQTCDLVLNEKTVSAEHARLSYHHGNWWVEDLQSRNGTLLNLEILSTSAVVVSGDELQLGQVIIRVEIGDSENHSPVADSKS
jgi:pSer/pThr/pTyr-binding forkhead associated (FHA) protein